VVKTGTMDCRQSEDFTSSNPAEFRQKATNVGKITVRTSLDGRMPPCNHSTGERYSALFSFVSPQPLQTCFGDPLAPGPLLTRTDPRPLPGTHTHSPHTTWMPGHTPTDRVCQSCTLTQVAALPISSLSKNELLVSETCIHVSRLHWLHQNTISELCFVAAVL
jgi:hypothetical protein